MNLLKEFPEGFVLDSVSAQSPNTQKIKHVSVDEAGTTFLVGFPTYIEDFRVQYFLQFKNNDSYDQHETNAKNPMHSNSCCHRKVLHQLPLVINGVIEAV